MPLNVLGAFKIFGPLLVWQQIIELFVIDAIFSSFLQITKLVKTINVINWHSLIYQVLNSRFGTIPILNLILGNSRETKKIFQEFHPLDQILYTRTI
jgi:hypothetical protein